MDRATERYRKAMIEPGTGGNCRYCHHGVDDRHVQASNPNQPVWCADCEHAGTVCGSSVLLATRAKERETAKLVGR